MIVSAPSPLAASALVAAGGAVGALARYHLGRSVTLMLGESAASAFPWATFTINIAGSLAMGVLMGWFIRQGATHEGLRLLIGVGLLGGFTTFSTFSFEMLVLLQRGAVGPALAYATGSVLAGLAAAVIGMMIARGAA